MNQIVVARRNENFIDIIDLSTNETLHKFAEVTQTLYSIGCCSDLSRLVGSSHDRTLKLWQTQPEACLASINAGTLLYCACMSHGGRFIATASTDSTMSLRDGFTAEPIWTNSIPGRFLREVQFNHTDSQIAGCGEDPTVRLWDVTSSEEIFELNGHLKPVTCICFHPNDTLLVTGSDDNTVRVWNVSIGEEVLSMQGSHGGVLSVRFTPITGDKIASGGKDFKMKIWDSDTGELLLTLPHFCWVRSLSFNEDGSRLVSSSEAIHIWDTTTWTEVNKIDGWLAIFPQAGNSGGYVV